MLQKERKKETAIIKDLIKTKEFKKQKQKNDFSIGTLFHFFSSSFCFH